MAQMDSSSVTRCLAIMSELNVNFRRDEFSVQLTSDDDKFIFIRVCSEGFSGSEYSITDLNHSGWTIEQEAKAIELALRQYGVTDFSKIWFNKPEKVRGVHKLEGNDEIVHLSKVLKQFAQNWPAFIDGNIWREPRRLGADFLAK